MLSADAAAGISVDCGHTGRSWGKVIDRCGWVVATCCWSIDLPPGRQFHHLQAGAFEFPPCFHCFATLLLAVLLLPMMKRPPKGQAAAGSRCLCNGVLHFGLSFWAISLSSTIASPAIVMQSYVPMATLLAWWMLGERFAWRTGAAIVLSFAGVLVLGFDPAVLSDPLALLLMLVSALFLAIGTVLMRNLRGMDPVQPAGDGRIGSSRCCGSIASTAPG